MNSAESCGTKIASSCAAPPFIPIAEILERFGREAERGLHNTGRYRCPYYVWGQGPPLVFIHGLADSSQSFWPVIAHLTDSFRCIGYELPKGRGDRAWLWRYRHADLVDDFFSLLNHLSLPRVYVYGSSFGSTIALTAAHADTKRLPRVIVQGGFARRPLGRGELLAARLARHIPGLMGQLPYRERIIRRGHFGPFAQKPAEMWMFCLDSTGTCPVAAAGYHALILNQVDLRPLLPNIPQPVFMICGDRDPLIGREHEKVLLHGLPNAGQITLENCGHTPTFTHPGSVAALVKDFLTPPTR
jgi:pimeloyl-ACP methyl ester carboxylesterase